MHHAASFSYKSHFWLEFYGFLINAYIYIYYRCRPLITLLASSSVHSDDYLEGLSLSLSLSLSCYDISAVLCLSRSAVEGAVAGGIAGVVGAMKSWPSLNTTHALWTTCYPILYRNPCCSDENPSILVVLSWHCSVMDLVICSIICFKMAMSLRDFHFKIAKFIQNQCSPRTFMRK